MPFTKPKGYVTGFNVRNGDYWDNNTALVALCESVIIDFNLSDLFPTAPVGGAGGTLTENATERDRILAQIQRARTLPNVLGKPYTVELRPRSGFWDPDWLKAAVGRMDWATDNGWTAALAPYKGAAVPGAPGAYYWVGGVTKWWDPAAIPYRAMMTDKLLSLFASTSPTDVVVALTVAWTSTQFTEPANKQFGIQQNVDTALANGYTLDLEQAMLVASWQDALPRAQQYGLSIGTSWNTYGKIDDTVTPAKFRPTTAEPFTFNMIDKMGSILGIFSQPQNHSFDGTFVGGDRTSSAERRLWDKLASVQSQISEQTATLVKLKADAITVTSTVEAAIAMGTLRLELPGGVELAKNGAGYYLDQAYARTWSPRITYLPQRDPAIVVPPGGGGGGGGGGTVTPGSWVSDWLTGTTAGTNALTITMPASVPDDSTLWLFPAAGAAVTIDSVTGGSGAPVAVVAPVDSTGAAAPDHANGTNLHTIGWAIPVSSADAGHTVTANLSAPARGAIVGRVSYGWDLAAAGVSIVNADQGASAAVTPADPTTAGPTIVVTTARVSTGTTAVTQPGGDPLSTATADTGSGTGYNVIVKAAEYAPGQAGAGTIVTDPAALKFTSYTLALTSPVVVTPPVDPPVDPGPTDPGGTTPPPPPVDPGTTTPPSPPPTLPPPPPDAPHPTIRWVGVRYDGRILAQLPTLIPDGPLRRTMGRAETVTLTLTVTPTLDPAWAEATLEGATAVIAYTGDPGAEAVVWGGIVTRRVVADGAVKLTAVTFEAYPEGRYTRGLSLSGRPSQVIAQLASRLAVGDPRAPGIPGWTVRTKVADNTAASPSGSWTWKDDDDKTIADAIAEVAAGTGPAPAAQWCTGWVWEHGAGPDGTDLVLPIVTAGRRIGRATSTTGQAPVSFSQTMTVQSEYRTEYGSGKGANLVVATAAAGGAQQRVTGLAYSTTGPRRPLWETRLVGPGSATSADLLTAYAGTVVSEVGDGRQGMSFTLARLVAPPVGTAWDLGDDAAVTLDGFTNGGTTYGPVTLVGQVVGYDLTAGTVQPFVAVDGGDGS